MPFHHPWRPLTLSISHRRQISPWTLYSLLICFWRHCFFHICPCLCLVCSCQTLMTLRLYQSCLPCQIWKRVHCPRMTNLLIIVHLSETMVHHIPIISSSVYQMVLESCRTCRETQTRRRPKSNIWIERRGQVEQGAIYGGCRLRSLWWLGRIA